MSHGDETEGPSRSFVEQPRLPWRSGYPGSAWVLIGAGDPHQIDLIDPARSQPFAAWLGSAHAQPPG